MSDSSLSPGLSRRWGTLALAALFAAFLWPLQGGAANERSHYALVRALANGVAEIDETRFETGDFVSTDVTYWDGHVYSNKAPGLAVLSLPAYVTARALGVPAQGDPTTMLWVLSLVGAALPALLVLVLLRRVADGLAPGTGTAVAVVLGSATLVLPFATLYHSHVLASALVFAAFASLLLLRARWPIASAALAGTLGGYAVTTEYASALAVAVLGFYAAAAAPALRRLVVYAGGVAVGLAPLFAYNRWAFGSFGHFSWAGTTETGGGRPSVQVVGSARPRLETMLESVLGITGLFTTAPVLLAAVVGLVLLARSGRRADAAALGAVVVAYVAFNASYGSEFDSYTGGERYLIGTLPLLCAPLGLALTRWPVTTGALTIVSAILMAALTSTHVRTGDGDWLGPVSERRFPPTVGSFLGVTGWYAIGPFFVALAVALVVAGAAALTRRPSADDTAFAGAALLGWAVVAASAPRTPSFAGDSDELGAYLPAATVALTLGCAIVAAKWLQSNSRVRRRTTEVPP